MVLPSSAFPNELDLHTFFSDDCEAWGMVMSRAGKVQRRFKVNIRGHREGDSLVLDERFVFDDGERDHRVWTIEHRGHSVSGYAGDVIGQAGGHIHGPLLQWSYDVEIKVGKRKVQVRFDDWMVMAGSDVMLSRAVIKKFGFRVADVFIAFRRVGEFEVAQAA